VTPRAVARTVQLGDTRFPQHLTAAFRRAARQVSPAMFVSPAFSAPVLRKREDRRKRQRFAYPAAVRIDGRPVPGRDISPKGLSVLVSVPSVGDIVRVTLAGATGDANEISAPARVVRVDPSPEGVVVGLEFIE
jgi:hypothetical protein